MVCDDDGKKEDIIKRIFGEVPVRARYYAGDIGHAQLNGYLQAGRKGILEQTGAVAVKRAIELHPDGLYKKGAFQVGAARVVPARISAGRIRGAELYQAQSLDGAVTVDFRDGIIYAKNDLQDDELQRIHQVAASSGLEYRLV
jgi:hypothetical protein